LIYAKVAVPVPLDPHDLLIDYLIPEALQGRVAPGSLVRVPFGRKHTWALVFGVGEPPGIDPARIKPIAELILAQPIFDSAKLNFLLWLSRHYFYPIGEVCEAAIPAPVREGTARTLKDPPTRVLAADVPREAPKHLNDEQRAAVESALAQTQGTHLLWGVTGSGKTEVYLQLIEEKLKAGQGAILLVPEISLTPQLTTRFELRFPGEVSIFHSALKPTQLRTAWLQAYLGQRRIAIGARSAIFAPVRDLGILIVDEEHDGSYKQDDRLRYNARDGAIVLGGLAKAPVILGSATPSGETLHAVNLERTRVSKLPHRATAEAQLPTVEVIDLKDEFAVENKTPLMESSTEFEVPTIKGDFFLSPPLRAAIEATLAQKKQTILFLNRRGLGSQLICRSCGHTPNCPNCEVNLTPHMKTLMCHYCGYELPQPDRCGGCTKEGDPYLQVGIGTESIERALSFHFPQARTLRLDRDTTQSQAEFESVLSDFGKGAADVLIGTQMVAKGHDFPNVTLVGIILAEMGLAVPDYRANERCLQLLLQVSGRAGRGIHPGRVLLQTFRPEHPVITALTAQRSLEDYKIFIEGELQQRQMLGYPPLGRLVLFRFDGMDADRVRDTAEQVSSALRRIRADDLRILGPVPSPLSKLRGRYRWQILLKAQHFDTCRKAVTWIQSTWHGQRMESKSRTRLTVDVDPINML
jgi:primosomal protein N' (replication factor Y)